MRRAGVYRRVMPSQQQEDEAPGLGRPVWSGALSFGLINIPMRVFTATEDHDVRFRQVHAADGARVRNRRVCSIDGTEISYEDIAKGYELPDGDMVVLDADDMAQLPLKSTKTMEIVSFVPSEQIDSIRIDRSYYLAPTQSHGAKPYKLLVEAMTDTDRVAVVQVALRSREAIGVIRPFQPIGGLAAEDETDGGLPVLVLQTLLWDDEIRSPSGIAPAQDEPPRRQELTMTSSLIDSMSHDFDPDEFHDDYQDAVQAMIDAKISGNEIKTPQVAADDADEAGGGTVTDLMAALRASIERAENEPQGRLEKKAAAKQAAAKKTAKKTAKKAAPKRRIS